MHVCNGASIAGDEAGVDSNENDLPVLLRVGIRPLPKDGDCLARVFEEVPGTYEVLGKRNGRPYYKRKNKQADDRDMFLYYWELREEVVQVDSEDASGWRFGRSTDGREPWAWRYESERDEFPPAQGWSVRLEGRERERDHPEELLVFPDKKKVETKPSRSALCAVSLTPSPSRGGSVSDDESFEQQSDARTDTPSCVNLGSDDEDSQQGEEKLCERVALNETARGKLGANSKQTDELPRRTTAMGKASAGADVNVDVEKHSLPALPRRRSSEITCKYSNFVGRKCIDLSGKSLDDKALQEWLMDDGKAFVKELGDRPRLDTIDMSRNKLTDQGLEILINFLLDHKVGARRMRLFGNQFREASAIGWMIEDREVGAGYYLRELHLSDNKLVPEALEDILDSLFQCATSGKGFSSPFWLRAELNEALVGLEDDIIRTHRGKGLSICTEAESKFSVCKLWHCQHNADVHLILKARKSTKNSTKENNEGKVRPSSKNSTKENNQGSIDISSTSRTENHRRAIRSRSRSKPKLVSRQQKETRDIVRICETISMGHSARRSSRGREREASSNRHRKEERRRSRSRSRRASPARRVHMSHASRENLRRQDKATSSSFDNYEYAPHNTSPCEIQLAGKSLGYDDLRKWCREDGPWFISKNRKRPWDRLDLSRNDITDRGVSRLVEFLQENRQPVVRLMLFMNRLVDPDALCRLIEDSEIGVSALVGLAELHLSSNNISLMALKRMVESLRRRAQQCARFKQPIWLRVERNPSLEDAASEFAKTHWSSNFKICLDGGKPESGCSLSYCRHNADVHLHLFGANRRNRVGARSGRW